MTRTSYPAEVQRMLLEIEEEGRWDLDALEAFYENNRSYWDRNPDSDEFRDEFDEAYAGLFSSIGEYARESYEGEVDLDRWPFSCIDWDEAGRELERDSAIWTYEAGYHRVHVFHEM